MNEEVTEENQVSMVSWRCFPRIASSSLSKKAFLNTHLKDFIVKSALLSENMVLNTY